MYYFYGNDYKEAIANDPVDITTVKQLKGYQDNYQIIVQIDDVYDNREEFETKEELEVFISEEDIIDYKAYYDTEDELFIIYFN